MYKQELKSLHFKKNLFGEPTVTPPLGTVYASNPLALTTNPNGRRHRVPIRATLRWYVEKVTLLQVLVGADVIAGKFPGTGSGPELWTNSHLQDDYKP